MEFKQLGSFVRVAELGSYTRAAMELNVAQPALSRVVRALEVELGQHLFRRNGRGVTLTAAGEVLLAHSRGVIHQLARCQDELAALKNSAGGSVSVGLPPTLARLLSVPLMRAFRETLPDARLMISEGLTAALHESVVKGRLDIALLYSASRTAEIECVHLLKETLVLVSRKPHRFGASITLSQLSEIPLVIPTRSNALRIQIDVALSALGLKPNVALEVDGVGAILALVADGAGCAVLTSGSVNDATKNAQFAAIPIMRTSREQMSIALSLAQSMHRPTTRAQRETMAILQKIAPQVLLK